MMQTAVPDLPTWTGIRAWIDEAEATQKRTGSACHISCVQLLALSQFANFFEEPEMSTEEDYVSKLMGMTSLCTRSSERWPLSLSPEEHFWL